MHIDTIIHTEQIVLYITGIYIFIFISIYIFQLYYRKVPMLESSQQKQTGIHIFLKIN